MYASIPLRPLCGCLLYLSLKHIHMYEDLNIDEITLEMIQAIAI